MTLLLPILYPQKNLVENQSQLYGVDTLNKGKKFQKDIGMLHVIFVENFGIKKGSPTILENHLGNLCVKTPVEVHNLFLEQLITKAAEVNESTTKKRKYS